MAIITGTIGDDNLDGGADDDIIDGLDGTDKLFGFGGNDTLLGGAGNDYLDGGTGADTMVGGLDHDIYLVDNALDTVTELVGEGQDTVISSIDYILGSDVELLYLTTGSVAVSGTGNDLGNEIGGNANDNTLNGMAGNDGLYGRAGNDTLIGGEGDDFLDGEIGADTMMGGLGNDTAVVDDVLDSVIEQGGQGIDTVISSIDYTLGEYLDLLYLASGSTAVSGTGNNEANEIGGNANDNTLNGMADNDVLFGRAGNDTLIGGTDRDSLHGESGNDTLVGGTGHDKYYFNIGDGVDTITDVAVLGEDPVLSPLSNTVEWGLGITQADLTLSFSGEFFQIRVGANGDMVQMSGFNPNDVYGTHAVEAYYFSDTTFLLYQQLIDLKGFTIEGTANADTLMGTNAVDHMFAYAGDDTYVVSTGDTVVEQVNEGLDTVQSDTTFTLGANIENLTLTGTVAIDGTGNSLNNILIGNSAANVLTGGAGDDIYNVGTGDSVVEQAAEGSADLVQSSVSFTLGDNVENLTLTGADAIDGIGNSLNNILTGNLNSAANLLTGGAGHDTYVVGTGDTVVENTNEGVDHVVSDVTFTLDANVEKLTLTGADVIDGTGNSLSNTLTGNSAANVLTGGAGNDTYVVGTGDTVVENTNEGVDHVVSDVTF
ncbi:MAG: calcium-binding protein, partial [Nitrospira sp. CG24C]